MAEAPETFCDLPCRDARHYFPHGGDVFSHMWLVDEKWLLAISPSKTRFNTTYEFSVYLQRRSPRDKHHLQDPSIQKSTSTNDMLGAYKWLRETLLSLIEEEQQK